MVWERKSRADLPIVCTLTPDGLRTGREGLLSDLMRQAEGHDDLPEGQRQPNRPIGELDNSEGFARKIEVGRDADFR